MQILSLNYLNEKIFFFSFDVVNLHPTEKLFLHLEFILAQKKMVNLLLRAEVK
jgi:hypothetical protein